MGYRIIRAIPKGAKITVYEIKSDWTRIGNSK